MSFNGAGAFSINTAGQPVVGGTTITSAAFNLLTADLATGLSTAICKDGQTTCTQPIPFAQGATFAGACTFTAAITGLSAAFNGGGLGNSSLSVRNGNVGYAAFEAYQVTGGGGTSAIRATVNGATADLIAFYAGTTKVGSVTTDGATNVAYNTTSDGRLKENIRDAESASSIIDALQVRQWNWKAGGKHELFGFIAQEEVKVAPWAVQVGDDNPDKINLQWGRDDSKLVPLLVKEIQSLRARLAAAGIP